MLFSTLRDATAVPGLVQMRDSKHAVMSTCMLAHRLKICTSCSLSLLNVVLLSHMLKPHCACVFPYFQTEWYLSLAMHCFVRGQGS